MIPPPLSASCVGNELVTLAVDEGEEACLCCCVTVKHLQGEVRVFLGELVFLALYLNLLCLHTRNHAHPSVKRVALQCAVVSQPEGVFLGYLAYVDIMPCCPYYLASRGGNAFLTFRIEAYMPVLSVLQSLAVPSDDIHSLYGVAFGVDERNDGFVHFV